VDVTESRRDQKKRAILGTKESNESEGYMMSSAAVIGNSRAEGAVGRGCRNGKIKLGSVRLRKTERRVSQPEKERVYQENQIRLLHGSKNWRDIFLGETRALNYLNAHRLSTVYGTIVCACTPTK
jgi:hypothetical protein